MKNKKGNKVNKKIDRKEKEKVRRKKNKIKKKKGKGGNKIEREAYGGKKRMIRTAWSDMQAWNKIYLSIL